MCTHFLSLLIAHVFHLFLISCLFKAVPPAVFVSLYLSILTLLLCVCLVCCGFLVACCLFGCLFDLLLPIRWFHKPGAAAQTWVRVRVRVRVQRLQHELILAEQKDFRFLHLPAAPVNGLLRGQSRAQETSVYVRFSLLYKRDENKTNLAYKNLPVKEAHSSQHVMRGEPS